MSEVRFVINLDGQSVDNIEAIQKNLADIRRMMINSSDRFDLSSLERLAASTAETLVTAKQSYEDFVAKKAQLEAVIKENKAVIKSVQAEHTESVEEVLVRVGFDKKVIDGAFDRIERLVNRSRRNGYFKSSEQSDVYAEMRSISEYLSKFEMLQNDKLVDFSDIHCKKLFAYDFSIIRDYTRGFVIK